MFISGYLLKYGCKIRGVSLADIPIWGKRGIVWKKVKRLLLPYLSVSLVAFFLKYLMSSFVLRPIDFSFTGYMHMLFYPWDNVIIFFWFLPTLFLIFVIFIFFSHLCKDISFNIYTSLVLLFLLILIHIFNPIECIEFLNMKGVVDYMFYFVLGYCSCSFNIMNTYNNLYLRSVFLIFTSLVVVFILPPFIGKDVISALIGIWLSISLGQLYIRLGFRFLNHLYGASFAIYLFSWFPQVVSQQLFLGLTHAPWQVGTVLAVLTGIYVPFCIYKFLVKYKNTFIGKYLSLLLGH